MYLLSCSYTYGQPVVGLLKASFTIKRNGYWYSRRYSDKKIVVEKEVFVVCTVF